MRDIKAVIFDLSGTLYSNEQLDEAYPRMLYTLLAEARGISLDDAKKILSHKKKGLEAATGKHATKLSAMESLGFDRKAVHDAYCRIEPADYLRKDVRLSEFLGWFGGRYKLGIITNLRSAQAIKTLRALGVDETIFQRIIGEEDVANVKPSPEPFKKMLSLLSVPAGACMYVSDSVTKDLMPAKKLGFTTVLVGDPEIKPGQESSIDYRVKDVHELKKILGT